LQNPFSNSQWHDLLDKIVAVNDGDDQYIYLHVTRGVAKRDHAFPLNTAPTVFIMSNPLLAPPQELLANGCSAITATDNRWIRCDIKAISLLPNVLLRQMAVDVDALETILIRDGFLTEGAASNIFVVKNNLLLAPPKSHLMLPGITYDVVLELADANHIPYQIREISEEELQSADEIMLTSSTKEIMAVTRLNNTPVGRGIPGTLCQQLQKLYQHYKTTMMRSDS
jgi:D-alanine transaminase